MAKVNFTTDRIRDFQCEPGKLQSFMWDSSAPGLGLRANPGGTKSYVFQSKLNGRALRITLGTPRIRAAGVWDLDAARAEARRLQTLIDHGHDPRQVKADRLAAEQAEREAKSAAKAAADAAEHDARVAAAAAAVRDAVTLGAVWPEYMADRMASRENGWSKHHVAAHRKIIQAGGEKRSRSPKLTAPGPLASLAGVRLVDLTGERIEAWARNEAKARPSSARLAWRLLKACLNWCTAHKTYSTIVTANAAKSTKTRESLGKEKKRHDVLQREQLPAWFTAVRQIGNPVIAAYLQSLLLVGARREEVAALKWTDVNFQWNSMKLADKVEGFRMVPLTPFVAHLLAALPRRNEFVFSSPTSASGYIAEPRIAHNEAVAVAGLPPLTLHGLRRSFASLCEWTETPSGIAAQIQGHAPQGVREQNYIRRPLDLLRMWHVRIETWMLEQAGIELVPAAPGLRVVTVT
jgi:integrase